jgi:hypothetical protein
MAAADRAIAGQPPTVELSAACETGQCARCRGEVLSLLAPLGTRCEHRCHQRPEGR